MKCRRQCKGHICALPKGHEGLHEETDKVGIIWAWQNVDEPAAERKQAHE